MKKISIKAVTTLTIFVFLFASIKAISYKRAENYKKLAWETVLMFIETGDLMSDFAVKGYTAYLKFTTDGKELAANVKNKHQLIKGNMEKLKNAPKKYKDVYKLLLDLYAGHNQIYTYFNSKENASVWEINNIVKESGNIISKLEILIPPPKKK